MTNCSIDGCSSKVKARGWCNKHWIRWRNHGDPNTVIREQHIDLAGSRFGRLTVVEDTGERKHGQKVWLCSCDCGSTVKAQSGNLRSGNTKSCGCFQRDLSKERNKTHGETCGNNLTPEYSTWWSMIARCKYDSTHAYPWYGGKGIKVCNRWQGKSGYANFLEDMGRRPGRGWSIDRIDSNGDYEPSNCRWLTMSENTARAHADRVSHWQ